VVSPAVGRRKGVEMKGRKWESVDEILTAAATNGVRLCTSKTCGCRRWFTVIEEGGGR